MENTGSVCYIFVNHFFLFLKSTPILSMIPLLLWIFEFYVGNIQKLINVYFPSGKFQQVCVVIVPDILLFYESWGKVLCSHEES